MRDVFSMRFAINGALSSTRITGVTFASDGVKAILTDIMKIYFDFEFLEDGSTIDLMSFGAVREDGEELYLVSTEYSLKRVKADEWLMKHVVSQFPEDPNDPVYVSRAVMKSMKSRIVEFAGKDPEFIVDYGGYDWVGLCQLFGKMLDLPKGWPMFARDVQQFKESIGMKGDFPNLRAKGEKEHHALHDARECKARWEYLEKRKSSKLKRVGEQ